MMATEQIMTKHRHVPDALRAGGQTICWFGMRLRVPRDWNMTAYRGDRARGVIVLADLHDTRLEVRWQKYSEARIPFVFKKASAALQQKSDDLPLLQTVDRVLVEVDQGYLAMVCGTDTLFELSFPQPYEHMKTIAHLFFDGTAQKWWRWQVYNVAGAVPVAWQFKKCQLQPGATRLEFQRRSGRINLGGFSMADRLLAGRSLPQWATTAVPMVQANLADGIWSQQRGLTRFSVAYKGLLRHGRHQLSLWHKPQTNSILWIETQGRSSDEPIFIEAAKRFACYV